MPPTTTTTTMLITSKRGWIGRRVQGKAWKLTNGKTENGKPIINEEKDRDERHSRSRMSSYRVGDFFSPTSQSLYVSRICVRGIFHCLCFSVRPPSTCPKYWLNIRYCDFFAAATRVNKAGCFFYTLTAYCVSVCYPAACL